MNFQQQPNQPSDFALYLASEKAKSVPMENYNDKTSLRIWIKTYEQQATVHGIQDYNQCATHISKFMPPIIQKWIPTLPATVRVSWDLLVEALLDRFGIPVQEENRQLLKDLKNTKQEEKESIRIHAAKWEYKLSLISDQYDEETKIYMFIQSLRVDSLKLTLMSLYETNNITTLATTINKGIHLEEKAKLFENSDYPNNQQQRSSDDMDIGHVRRHKGRNTKKYYQDHRNQFNNQQQYQQLRAYDKFGNPICDHCKGTHRTIDCRRSNNQQRQHAGQQKHHNNDRQQHNNKHRKARNTIQNIDADEQGFTPVAPNDAYSVNHLSVDVANLARETQQPKLPQSILQFGNQQVVVLWDTGAAITGISLDTATKLNLKPNKNYIIAYRDVNNNINNTHGTVNFTLFGVNISAHVINKLSSPL